MTRLVRSEPVPMWPRGDRGAAPVGVTDVGHRVEGAETQGECQLGSSLTHPGDDRPQEARPVLQRSTEVAVALVGAEQLVMEVPVAGLEIDEVEAGFMGVDGGLDEVVGQLVSSSSVSSGWSGGGPTVVSRCGWRRTATGAAFPDGAGWLIRPECVSCSPTTRSVTSPWTCSCSATRPPRSFERSLTVASATISCDGVLRPSGRTAADSAQINLAPPAPIRRHRSRVGSVGRPSRSHPSLPEEGRRIGCRRSTRRSRPAVRAVLIGRAR